LEQSHSWIIQTDEGDIEPWEQRDTYLDDDEFSLNSAGAALRIRKKGDKRQVTLKIRHPLQTTGYNRIKERAAITQRQKEDLLTGKPVNVLPYQIIPYVVPFCRCHQLSPRLELNCKRKLIKLSNVDRPVGRALICIDLVNFKRAGSDDAIVTEVEIKGQGADPEMVKRLADDLARSHNLKEIKLSRYEYGISLQK